MIWRGILHQRELDKITFLFVFHKRQENAEKEEKFKSKRKEIKSTLKKDYLNDVNIASERSDGYKI